MRHIAYSFAKPVGYTRKGFFLTRNHLLEIGHPCESADSFAWHVMSNYYDVSCKLGA